MKFKNKAASAGLCEAKGTVWALEFFASGKAFATHRGCATASLEKLFLGEITFRRKK